MDPVTPPGTRRGRDSSLRLPRTVSGHGRRYGRRSDPSGIRTEKEYQHRETHARRLFGPLGHVPPAAFEEHYYHHRNVVTPNRPSARQIAEWRLASGGNEIVAERQGFDDRSDYLVSLPGTPPQLLRIDWQGLNPLQSGHLADWTEGRIHTLRNWALGVRHLQCPRSLRASPFATPEHSPAVLGSDGREAELEPGHDPHPDGRRARRPLRAQVAGAMALRP